MEIYMHKIAFILKAIYQVSKNWQVMAGLPTIVKMIFAVISLQESLRQSVNGLLRII